MNDNMTSFSAVVKFDDGHEDTYDITLNKGIDALTYDEVVNAFDDAVDKSMGYSFSDDEVMDPDFKLPYEIVDIVINEDGESYPVVAEDADTSALSKSTVFEKYLVLPYATYSLTPECKLWMKLKENGMLKEDAPFDYDTYHDMLTMS